MVAGAGWACVRLLQVPAAGFFGVVASSLVVYALTLAAAIRLGGWAQRRQGFANASTMRP